MEVVVTTVSQTQRRGEEVQICLLIMEMFHMLPASTFRLFEPLLALCLKGEKSLGTEVCVCVCLHAYMVLHVALCVCLYIVCVCILCVCILCASVYCVSVYCVCLYIVCVCILCVSVYCVCLYIVCVCILCVLICMSVSVRVSAVNVKSVPM